MNIVIKEIIKKQELQLTVVCAVWLNMESTQFEVLYLISNNFVKRVCKFIFHVCHEVEMHVCLPQIL